jgi:hypothetical protein
MKTEGLGQQMGQVGCDQAREQEGGGGGRECAGGAATTTDSREQNFEQLADGEGFPISEVGLAKHLGVARSVLKSIRKNLKKGGDWEVMGKEVRWSEEAALGAARALRATREPEPETNVSMAPLVNEDRPNLESLKVVKLLVNPHMVQAARKNGEVVMVNVVHSRNFKRGMEFRAAPDGVTWRLVGRTPRYPGRW